MKIPLLHVLAGTLFSITSIAQGIKVNNAVTVKVCSAMSKLMWEGRLEGNINLDTIQQKQHLYGIGPIEYLKGEILVVDGRSYTASVATDTSMLITETFNVKAPFFVYANVPSWNEYILKNGIRNMKQLEAFLLETFNASGEQPFVFRIKALVDSASIHLVNLPKGTIVQSPDDAHNGQKSYTIKNQEVEIVGFFSTRHKGIFTHHDSFVHMHLVSTDKKMMGHLDTVLFAANTVRIYLH